MQSLRNSRMSARCMTAASVFPRCCSAIDENFFLSTLVMIAFFDEEKKISLCAVRTNSYFMQYCDTVSLYSNFSPGFNGLQSLNNTFSVLTARVDRLCGLVVRVSDYRYRGPGFDSRRYQIF